MTSWMMMALHLQALVSQVHLAQMLHDSFFLLTKAVMQLCNKASLIRLC